MAKIRSNLGIRTSKSGSGIVSSSSAFDVGRIMNGAGAGAGAGVAAVAAAAAAAAAASL